MAEAPDPKIGSTFNPDYVPPPAPPLVKPSDIGRMFDEYYKGTPGYGLMQMWQWVLDSQLPPDVKWKFRVQYARGMVYLEDFKDD
jgi:hypothetical protein